MSSESRSTLFGMTLTELVIILFFMMLLLALDRITQLVDEISDTVPTAPIMKMLIPDGAITSDMIPADVIRDKIEELQRKEQELEELEKKVAEAKVEEEAKEKAEGDGDCREGGYWMTSKCADHCWEIDNPGSSRKYDNLLDIGVCKSSVVVQKSRWTKKTDSDFATVVGASEAVEKRYMSKSELYKKLEVIKTPGSELEPRQCFHTVNLIDLGAGSIDKWQTVVKEVQNQVGALALTASTPNYKDVRERFRPEVCEISSRTTVD